MKQKSDSVFLLTLVDLLVQIIFLAIFVGAVYIASEGKDDAEKKRISDPNAKIIVEIGVLKVAELVNAMVKLVPIDRLMELAVILPEFKSIEALKAALKLATTAKFDPGLLEKQNQELEKKIAYGVGRPTCVFGPEKLKNIFSIQETSNSFIIFNLTPKARELFSNFNMNFSEGHELSFDQFERFAKIISNSEKDCRFQVTYMPSERDSGTAYRIVRKYFYDSISFKSQFK